METSVIQKFNRSVPWPFRLLIVAVLALAFAYCIMPRITCNGWAVIAKLRGKAKDCSWSQVVFYYGNTANFAEKMDSIAALLSVKDYDPALGIELIASPYRSFWISRFGDQSGGKDLLKWLIAEHDWMAQMNPLDHVHKGDIVIDCGAHVGVFTNKALQLGAKSVVAIEPDPVNLECLRRNYSKEISTGQVIVVPLGVWSSQGKMTLFISKENSGMSSLVSHEKGGAVEVPTDTIDNLTNGLGLPHVDFIKMDIEGAEREALKGAIKTLRRDHPRLLLDAYHLEDDMEVLPKIIRSAAGDYKMTCGPCQPSPCLERNQTIVPHVVYFR